MAYPLPTTAYPTNPFADAVHGIGKLLPMMMAIKQANAKRNMMSQPLGKILGFENAMLPTEGPVTATGAPPAPVADPTQFMGAPAALQPVLRQPARNIASLKDALGENLSRDIFGSMGIGRSAGTQLEYDEKTGEFRIKPGTTGVTAQNAGIILRQDDIKNKRNISNWRDAVEARLQKAQLANEERIALNSDKALLDFMLSPNFDLMDDSFKQQMAASATAAINRLKQRGVTVFTGERDDKTTPAPGKPAPTVKVPTPQPVDRNARRTARAAELKKEDPSLTNEQIAAQIAIEEESEE